MPRSCSFFFFFNDTATTEIYTLSLHDALPILDRHREAPRHRKTLYRDGLSADAGTARLSARQRFQDLHRLRRRQDRKSTRLNSSHQIISYAVFCLKKKKKPQNIAINMIANRPT